MLIVLSATFFGCQSSTSITTKKKSEEPLRVALYSWVGITPIYIAQAEGFFADQGLSVEIISTDDLSATKTMLAQGDVDIVAATGDMLPTYHAAAIKAKAFYAIDYSNGGDGIIVSKDIKNLEDLRGKTVYGESGWPPLNLLYFALEEAGIAIDSINYQEMKTDEAGVAFQAEKIQAAALYQPYLYEAIQREESHIILDSSDYEYVITDYVVATESTLIHKKEALKNFIAALDATHSFIEKNPQRSIDITAKQFRLDPSEVQAIFGDIVFVSSADNRDIFMGNNIKKTFETFQQAMKKAGVLRKTFPTSDLIDTSIIQ